MQLVNSGLAHSLLNEGRYHIIIYHFSSASLARLLAPAAGVPSHSLLLSPLLSPVCVNHFDTLFMPFSRATQFREFD